MERQNFIKEIEIKKVRHLANISIPISQSQRRHLILTGKNGSGKTSVLEALKSFLEMIPQKMTLNKLTENINIFDGLIKDDVDEQDQAKRLTNINCNDNKQMHIDQYNRFVKGLIPSLVDPVEAIEGYQKGRFIIAYFSAVRDFRVENKSNVEKVVFQDNYEINYDIGKDFIKYILDLKTSQALYSQAGDLQKASEIDEWFSRFERLLKEIFEDDKLKINFDISTFKFSISATNREDFDFSTLSSGYSAMLDIVIELMLRMEKNVKEFYNIQGIVLIDEIENHLHLELHKKILPFLTRFFPNIQFIVTTHSPFILSSLENAVIYDLENSILVENGLSYLPYSGIVDGYFGVNTLSKDLIEKFERYKLLAKKKKLENSELTELSEIETYLDEIPNYLAVDFSPEYDRLKTSFLNRG